MENGVMSGGSCGDGERPSGVRVVEGRSSWASGGERERPVLRLEKAGGEEEGRGSGWLGLE